MKNGKCKSSGAKVSEARGQGKIVAVAVAVGSGRKSKGMPSVRRKEKLKIERP